MKIGEVCLLTNDAVHQFLIADETTLAVHSDGRYKNNDNHNICLAFTVDDVDEKCQAPKKYGCNHCRMGTTYTLEALKRGENNEQKRSSGGPRD